MTLGFSKLFLTVLETEFFFSLSVSVSGVPKPAFLLVASCNFLPLTGQTFPFRFASGYSHAFRFSEIGTWRLLLPLAMSARTRIVPSSKSICDQSSPSWSIVPSISELQRPAKAAIANAGRIRSSALFKRSAISSTERTSGSVANSVTLSIAVTGFEAQ